MPGQQVRQVIRVPYKDTLPEWSKGVDSSSTSASCVGSNPTGVIFLFLFRVRVYTKRSLVCMRAVLLSIFKLTLLAWVCLQQ